MAEMSRRGFSKAVLALMTTVTVDGVEAAIAQQATKKKKPAKPDAAKQDAPVQPAGPPPFPQPVDPKVDPTAMMASKAYNDGFDEAKKEYTKPTTVTPALVADPTVTPQIWLGKGADYFHNAAKCLTDLKIKGEITLGKVSTQAEVDKAYRQNGRLKAEEVQATDDVYNALVEFLAKVPLQQFLAQNPATADLAKKLENPNDAGNPAFRPSNDRAPGMVAKRTESVIAWANAVGDGIKASIDQPGAIAKQVKPGFLNSLKAQAQEQLKQATAHNKQAGTTPTAPAKINNLWSTTSTPFMSTATGQIEAALTGYESRLKYDAWPATPALAIPATPPPAAGTKPQALLTDPASGLTRSAPVRPLQVVVLG